MTRVDSAEFFEGLRREMNEHPERFGPLGEAELTCGVRMLSPGGDACFVIELEGIGCARADAVAPDALLGADFVLEGPVEAFAEMFADIAAHGRATGRWTLNSLALLGDRIVLAGTDPMGLDTFSRFNQTLQEFFDGAARRAAPVA